jgi:hypothetical protein
MLYSTKALNFLALYEVATRPKRPFIDLLTREGRRRRDRRIPRVSLLDYSGSAFKRLLDSGSDQSLLNACGHDHGSFQSLVDIFQPVYDSYYLEESSGLISPVPLTTTGKRKGRPRHLDAEGCLGLVLMWYRTRGAVSRSLCIMFGLTQTVMFWWLKFGKRVLLHILQGHPDAKIQKPTDDEVRSYVNAISSQYPHAQDVWAACDGLKLSMQAAMDDVTQNMFYNGWTHGHYISCIFVFAPDGKICICSFNSPGCWHDSTQADHGGVYDKIEEVYKATGGKVVIDSAFSLGNRGYFIKSSQLDPMDAQELLTNRDATSVRQLSEWGMRQIQAKFPRLKDDMPYEEQGERKVTLNLMILLYNFQTARVGMNQILNTYMLEISPDANYLLDPLPNT